MVIALSEAEFQQHAEPALKKLFRTPEPYFPTYGEAAESRKILCEYRSPDPKLTSALAQLGAELGDDGFFFSNLLGNPPFQGPEGLELPNHWWIPFDEISVFLSCNTDIFNFAYQLENATYSPNSHWGILGGFDGWGILAGTNFCIDRLLQILPEIDRQIFDFLDSTRHYQTSWGVRRKLDWLPICLEMTYGKEAAVAMLKEFQLDHWLD